MKSQATASAPAKVILLGEHLVVHGELAIVLAINKRPTVKAKARTDRKIRIRSNAVRASGYYLDNPFSAEEGGEAAMEKIEPIYAAVKDLLDLSSKRVGVSIDIDSSIPVAAGLGSSAAVAVASAAALDQLLETGLTKDEIFRAAFNVEKIVHGNPSGVAPAISTHMEGLSCIEEARRSRSWMSMQIFLS